MASMSSKKGKCKTFKEMSKFSKDKVEYKLLFKNEAKRQCTTDGSWDLLPPTCADVDDCISGPVLPRHVLGRRRGRLPCAATLAGRARRATSR